MYKKIRQTKCYHGKGLKTLWKSRVREWDLYILTKVGPLNNVVMRSYRRRMRDGLLSKTEWFYFGKDVISVLWETFTNYSNSPIGHEELARVCRAEGLITG